MQSPARVISRLTDFSFLPARLHVDSQAHVSYQKLPGYTRAWTFSGSSSRIVCAFTRADLIRILYGSFDRAVKKGRTRVRCISKETGFSETAEVTSTSSPGDGRRPRRSFDGQRCHITRFSVDTRYKRSVSTLYARRDVASSDTRSNHRRSGTVRNRVLRPRTHVRTFAQVYAKQLRFRHTCPTSYFN